MLLRPELLQVHEARKDHRVMDPFALVRQVRVLPREALRLLFRAAELRRRLGPDVTDAATKILTTGVSGQQPALPLARLMSVPLVACRREAAGAGAVANAMGRGAYADALDVTYRSKLCGNQPVSEVRVDGVGRP